MKFKNADGTPMGYQPPLFGTKKILNFTAHSYPRLGALAILFGLGLTLIAFFIGKKKRNKK